MAFDGSGTFVRVHDWTDDADAAIKIRADRMDEEDDGFATGLSNCVTKDGQTTITANLPMAGYRHTGVGEPTARTQYATVAGLQDGKWLWVDGGGTADAITATYSPVLTALVDGQLCFVRATAANATTTPTFSPNGLTARTIVKTGGVALVPGDIIGDGHELILRYDLSNTRWELLNPGFGGQLKFPSTQNSSSDANTLDDYEEGTFTPSLSFGGASVGITYGVQDGTYTKIGNRVFYDIRIELSSKGSSTGSAVISGLPFTNLATTRTAGAYIANAGGFDSFFVTLQASATTILPMKFTNGTGVTAQMADTDFGNSTVIQINGHYIV